MCTKAAAVASYPRPEPEPFPSFFSPEWWKFRVCMADFSNASSSLSTARLSDCHNNWPVTKRHMRSQDCLQRSLWQFYFLSISISEKGYIYIFIYPPPSPFFWSYFANPYSSHPAKSVSAHPHETRLLPWMLYLGKQIFCLVWLLLSFTII